MTIQTILITISPAILVLALITILFVIWKINANELLKIVDQKIAEFKNKTFSSPEEKERAKQELKIELNRIKHTAMNPKMAWYKIDERIMLL